MLNHNHKGTTATPPATPPPPHHDDHHRHHNNNSSISCSNSSSSSSNATNTTTTTTAAAGIRDSQSNNAEPSKLQKASRASLSLSRLLSMSMRKSIRPNLVFAGDGVCPWKTTCTLQALQLNHRTRELSCRRMSL